MMFNAPIVAFFLILVATSAAVVGSMIVLALLDLAFGKKSTSSLVADVVENDQLTPPAEPTSRAARSKPKIKSLAPPVGGYRTKRKPTPGYGAQSQRVAHLER